MPPAVAVAAATIVVVAATVATARHCRCCVELTKHEGTKTKYIRHHLKKVLSSFLLHICGLHTRANKFTALYLETKDQHEELNRS